MAQVRKSRLDRPETVGGGLKGGGRAGSSVNNRTVTKGAPKNKVSSKVTIAKGKANPGSVDQIRKQNALVSGSASKAEAKTNASALKAANAKVSKGNATRQYFKDKIDMVQKSNPKMSQGEAAEWAGHPGYASLKSNQRLQAGKWSSDKQIKKWQDKEIKQDYGKKKSK